MNTKSIVYFNSNWNVNGNVMLSDIDTSGQQTVRDIIDQPGRCTVHNSHPHQFIVDLNGVLEIGDFINNNSTIAMETPGFPEESIHKASMRIRENITQKNIVVVLAIIIKSEKIL